MSWWNSSDWLHIYTHITHVIDNNIELNLSIQKTHTHRHTVYMFRFHCNASERLHGNKNWYNMNIVPINWFCHHQSTFIAAYLGFSRSIYLVEIQFYAFEMIIFHSTKLNLRYLKIQKKKILGKRIYEYIDNGDDYLSILWMYMLYKYHRSGKLTIEKTLILE